MYIPLVCATLFPEHITINITIVVLLITNCQYTTPTTLRYTLLEDVTHSYTPTQPPPPHLHITINYTSWWKTSEHGFFFILLFRAFSVVSRISATTFNNPIGEGSVKQHNKAVLPALKCVVLTREGSVLAITDMKCHCYEEFRNCKNNCYATPGMSYPT